MEKTSSLILVYYRFRGQLQPIRNLLCYLQVPHVEVHLERFEQQRSKLPLDVLNQLKGLKVDKSQLPVLIHEGITVSEVYPVMTYICYRFDSEDLLGGDIFGRAQLQQIMEIYLAKQPQSMIELFRVADQFVDCSLDFNSIRLLRQSYLSLMEHSGYLREICDSIKRQAQPGYVLGGQITILDFLFLQSCTYMLGGFQVLDKKSEKQYGNLALRRKNSILSEDSLYSYIDVMRQYQLRMMNEPFYQAFKDYLESFSIVSQFISADRAKGLKNFWQGNPKFVQ